MVFLRGKALWLNAMKAEISSFYKNDVYDIVNKPENVNIVTNKWVLKKKLKANGNIDRYKSRLVARGFNQVHGSDYFLRDLSVLKVYSVGHLGLQRFYPVSRI